MAFKTARLVALALLALAALAEADHPGHDDHDHGHNRKWYESITWKPRAELPTATSDMTASTVGDKIYVVGGCTKHQLACNWQDATCDFFCPEVGDKVLVYAPATDVWTTLDTAMPRPRYRHAAVVSGSKIYLFGGRDVDDDIITELDVLDTATGIWTTLSSWTGAKSDVGAFASADGTKMYVAGGYDAAYTSFKSVDTFEPETDTWTSSGSIPDMLNDRGDFAIVELNGKYYAYGGWSSSNWAEPLKKGEVYDPSTNKWTAIADLEEGRGDKACGVVDGKIYAIGGEHNTVGTTTSIPVDDVEAYDPTKPDEGWLVMSHIPESKFRFASASHDNTIYVFGGQSALDKDTHCTEADPCFPVTTHVWAMHENEHILIGVVVGGVLAFVLAFVAYRVRTGRCSACKKKPATEPAAEGGKNIGMV